MESRELLSEACLTSWSPCSRLREFLGDWRADSAIWEGQTHLSACLGQLQVQGRNSKGHQEGSSPPVFYKRIILHGGTVSSGV